DVDPRGRRRLVGAAHRLARTQQRLRRDARPVGALAADQLALDQPDAQAALGERAGAVLARRAAADDDDVVRAHVGSGLPPCSAPIQAAYHSGQPFGSATPVRVSCSPWATDARRIAAARSFADANVVSAASMRPGRRPVISWSSQPLPSGSRNEANER